MITRFQGKASRLAHCICPPLSILLGFITQRFIYYVSFGFYTQYDAANNPAKDIFPSHTLPRYNHTSTLTHPLLSFSGP